MLRKNEGKLLKKNKWLRDVHDSGRMAITALVPAARAELREGKEKKKIMNNIVNNIKIKHLLLFKAAACGNWKLGQWQVLEEEAGTTHTNTL